MAGIHGSRQPRGPDLSQSGSRVGGAFGGLAGLIEPGHTADAVQAAVEPAPAVDDLLGARWVAETYERVRVRLSSFTVTMAVRARCRGTVRTVR